jgi:hypothetical protein
MKHQKRSAGPLLALLAALQQQVAASSYRNL